MRVKIHYLRVKKVNIHSDRVKIHLILYTSIMKIKKIIVKILFLKSFLTFYLQQKNDILVVVTFN